MRSGLQEAFTKTFAPSQLSFHEIVVATDLSDLSATALHYATAIAKRYSSHILLVHVSPPLGFIPIPEGGFIEDPRTLEAAEEVEALGVDLRTKGFAAQAINAFGSVEREVMSAAKAHDADLIVLGTHRKRGIERLLFGSKAEALIRDSDRPVFTVGPSAVQPRNNVWLPKEVICVATPGEGSANAAAYAYWLAQENGAHFTLFYAEDPGIPAEPGEWKRFEESLCKVLPEGEARHLQIQNYFSQERPAAEIVEAAGKCQADLIVLGVKHAVSWSTHFRVGVLPDVLLHAPCPVLTIGTHLSQVCVSAFGEQTTMPADCPQCCAA